MKKIYSCIVAAAFLSINAFAQNTVTKNRFPLTNAVSFGQTENTNFIDGGSGSRAVLWSDDFSNPANWTLTEEAGTSNDMWTIGTTGPQGTFAIAPIASTTASNGFALFDSDFLCSFDQHAHLTTANSINLTGESNVQLKFQQHYRRWYDSTFVYVSNNGTAWTKFPVNVTYANNQASPNPDLVTVDISSVAANQATVWVRFTFYSPAGMAGGNEGCGYSWMVDDVSIESPPATEVELIDGIANPMQYPIIPLSQVQPYSFSGIITNTGGSSFSGANVNVNVNNGLYTATGTSGTLNPGDTATVAIPGAFTPTVTGAYAAAFDVSLTGDADPTNNVDTARFTVHDSIMARETATNLYFLNFDTVQYAQRFDVYNTDTLSTVSFLIYKPKVGDTVFVTIHDFTTGVPTTQVAQTVKYAIMPADTGATGAFKTLRIQACSSLILTPGAYAMVFHNRVQYSPGMIISATYYNAGTSLYSLNGGTSWTDIANVLPSSYVMRANFGRSTIVPLNASNTSTNILCKGASTGSIDVTVTGGTTTYSYLWSSSQTTQDLTNVIAGTYTVTVTDAQMCTATTSATITEPATAITVSTSTTAASCGASDGSATATATGGTGTLTYSWNTTPTQNTAMASNIPAGVYTVTVTDANACTKTATATVSNPGAPTITVISTDITCNSANDGTATATVTGGTAPYTFIWNPAGGGDADTAGLAPGTYIVTVTDNNGCSAAASATITEPTQLMATTTATQSKCSPATGTATVSASGGTTPYTYMWSNGDNAAMADSLAAGTYTVTVTDANSCTVIATANVTNTSSPAVTVSSTDATCSGGNDGSATANATGGTTPYTYMWSNGDNAAIADSLAVGTYTVTVTDANSCTQTATATVTITPSPTVTGTKDDNSTMGSINTTVTGGTAPYTYSWSSTVAGYSSTEADPDSIMAQGTYTVTVTDANGCTATASFTIAGTVTIKESAQNASSVKIYPNPNNGQFTIQLSEMQKGDYNFELRNILGQVIYTETVNLSGSFNKLLNFSTLSKGIYFLNVNGEATTTTQRIVIK